MNFSEMNRIDRKLFLRIAHLLAFMNENPPTLLAPPAIIESKTIWTCYHKNIKRKGGRPPVDYRAIEIKVDLEEAYNQGDPEQARPLFFQLRRLVNF